MRMWLPVPIGHISSQITPLSQRHVLIPRDNHQRPLPPGMKYYPHCAPIDAEVQPCRRVSKAPPQREGGAGTGPGHGHNLINDSASRIEIRVKSSISCSASRSCCVRPQAKVQIGTSCVPRDRDKQYFRPNCLHIHQYFHSRIYLCLFSSCH